MKWLLVWIVVGGGSGADLPEREVYSNREACQQAADILEDLETSNGFSEGKTRVSARCIPVES